MYFIINLQVTVWLKVVLFFLESVLILFAKRFSTTENVIFEMKQYGILYFGLS